MLQSLGSLRVVVLLALTLFPSFQSVKLVTIVAEVLVPCVPEMRLNQHQVMLLTVQLIHHVME